MLLQYLRVRGAGDFSRDRVLYFEVCGGTVCSTKSPQSFAYQAFFTAMFAHYVFMG